jgi:hypothetical protein
MPIPTTSGSVREWGNDFTLLLINLLLIQFWLNLLYLDPTSGIFLVSSEVILRKEAIPLRTSQRIG